ncbi:MAG: carboxypeptidase-like regulatory domain-containing protein [Pirellulaceae bacterium]
MFEFRRFGWFSFVSLLVPVLLAASGCGSKVISVSGTVTLDGAPLDGAAVSFVPNVAAGDKAPEGQTPANGQTDASGKFNLGSVIGPGAGAGSYKVGVSKLQAGNAAMSGDVPKGAPPGTMLSGGPPGPGGARQTGPPKDLVPAKYVNPDTSEIIVEVKSGMPPVTIELKSS